MFPQLPLPPAVFSPFLPLRLVLLSPQGAGLATVLHSSTSRGRRGLARAKEEVTFQGSEERSEGPPGNLGACSHTSSQGGSPQQAGDRPCPAPHRKLQKSSLWYLLRAVGQVTWGFSWPFPVGVGAVPSWEGSMLTPIAITRRQAQDSPSQEPGRPKGGGGRVSSDPANPPRASWEGGQLACGQDRAPG